MKIFLSWSGDLSYEVACLFKDWLPNVIQSIESPYLSSKDIEKGSAWLPDISNQLKESTFGLICLTSDNLTSPWLHFEAGAIANRFEMKHIPAFLVDIAAKDVKPPLSHFQLTLPNEDDVFGLLKTINNGQDDKRLSDEQLKNALKKWWPEFEEKFKTALVPSKATKRTPAKTRSTEDLLEEVLLISRETSKVVSAVAEQSRAAGFTSLAQMMNSQNQVGSYRKLVGYLSDKMNDKINEPQHGLTGLTLGDFTKTTSRTLRKLVVESLNNAQARGMVISIDDMLNVLEPASSKMETLEILHQLKNEGQIEWDDVGEPFSPGAIIRFKPGKLMS